MCAAGKLCLVLCMDGFILDLHVEAPFEKCICPKSNIITRAQADIMDKSLFKVFHEIQNIEVVPFRANIPQRLRLGLRTLKDDPNIIIMKVDKGDGVVILDSDHYHSLTAKHLACRFLYLGAS